MSVDDCHLYAFRGHELTCTERLDVRSILNGVGSVEWHMCPAVMLSHRPYGGRMRFAYGVLGGNGTDSGGTYICCVGGRAAGDLGGRDVQRYSVCRGGVWELLLPLPDVRFYPSAICVGQ